MKKVIVIPNPQKDVGLSVTASVICKLSEMGISPYLSEKYASYGLSGATYFECEPTDAELIIVIGGDGSVIDASVTAVKLDIPLLGVNLGKVGYLSEVDADNLDSLSKLTKGEYVIEDKMLLQVKKIEADGPGKSCLRFAVNDVVVSHDNYFGIADFRVQNGSGDRVKYRADGVIVSTPIGSTAYSLSAGGPIISHSVDAISVTPVCPHSFFNRTIVFGSGETVTVTNIGEGELNVSIDGRLTSKLLPMEACEVSSYDRRLKMVAFSGNNMFSVLFNKIKLLEDKG